MGWSDLCQTDVTLSDGPWKQFADLLRKDKQEDRDDYGQFDQAKSTDVTGVAL